MWWEVTGMTWYLDQAEQASEQHFSMVFTSVLVTKYLAAMTSLMVDSDSEL